MKVVGFNGSARKDGNTAILIREVFAELEKEGIETELIQLAGQKITGCTACCKCCENKDQKCVIDNDVLNDCLEKMLAADGVILGSPTYFADVTTETKALIDRAGFVSRANGDMLRRKVGAAVVAVRRAGSIHVYDTINHFFGISQMIVPGSSYWNMGIGLKPGDVSDDEEGLDTMRTLGANMAWLLKKLGTNKPGRVGLAPPQTPERITQKPFAPRQYPHDYSPESPAFPIAVCLMSSPLTM